jgi:23S rRNA (adenine2503-C2)-methyltransferase
LKKLPLVLPTFAAEIIMDSKQDIRKLNLNELTSIVTEAGEKAFRAKQIWEWIWNKSVTDFDAMSNLSTAFREFLKSKYEFRPVKIEHEQKSKDGTIKLAFRLYDDKIVEGVLIPTYSRMTACISSQVGCSLDCTFCATGTMKRERNIDAAEIYDQVVLINSIAQKYYDKTLTNIVYMGMGEPLLNYNNVMDSISHITNPYGLGMASSRITVSTAGIAKMIDNLTEEKVKFNLALSLHAATNEERTAIMPINESNPLEVLAESLKNFGEKTGNEVTLEYTVIQGQNDSDLQIQNLIKFAHKIPDCKINLIEYNPIGNDYESSGIEKIEEIAKVIKRGGVFAMIRRSRGKDIDAACGQLANKLK